MIPAFPITDPTQVAEPRRAVARLAEQLAFTESRAGQAALIATELASNLAKHAREGEMLFRLLRDDRGEGQAGIEILAVDKGPGMPDFARSRRDGFSTAGTLGHGLGAIERLADVFDMYSDASGTAAVAEIWRDAAPVGRRQPRMRVGGVSVPIAGERVNGDGWAYRLRDDRLAILVVDGLGHGLQAHDAATQAIAAFESAHEQSAERIVHDIHLRLRSTRGAAAAVLAVDLERGIGRYCGLGNISSHLLLASGARQTMVSHNGTAGHTAPRIHEFSYTVPPDATILMHSDGLGTHWDLARYPGLGTRHPALIAGVLYRDFSRRRDDMTVVAITPRARV